MWKSDREAPAQAEMAGRALEMGVAECNEVPSAVADLITKCNEATEEKYDAFFAADFSSPVRSRM